MKIYTGKIMNLYVTDIKFNGSCVDVVTDSYVVRKDTIFYSGFLGKLISFEYGTNLPTRDEASDYVCRAAKNHPDTLSNATCIYASYGEMTPVDVSKEEFKQLRKTYKEIRKNKKRA